MRAALLAGLVAAAAWLGPSSLVSQRAEAAAEPAIAITAAVAPDAMELHLDGTAARPIAVFQRGAVLWVLLDIGAREIVGLPSLERPDVAGWLAPIGIEPTDHVRSLRFTLHRPAKVQAVASAAGWRIRLGPPNEAPRPVVAGDRFERSVEHGRLETAADGELVQIVDPATGDRLGILLSATAGLRQAAPITLVDLELLPSTQGLVWRPLADGVTASLDAGRLILQRPGGLRLSHEATMAGIGSMAAETGQPAEMAAAAALPPEPIGLVALGRTDPATRQRERLDLLAGMRQLAGLPRAIARLELAKLYLADALGPEARTALELIDTSTLAAPAARALGLSKAAMTGAAAAVTGQHDRALAMLLDHSLDQDPEVALWRAYAAARATRWELATQEWARSGALLDGYPEPLRRLLGLEMASAMAEQGDADAALGLIDRLRPLALSAGTRARLSLIEGLGRARIGRTAEAEQAFEAAAAGGDDDIRTRAGFLLTSLRQERGALSAAAAAAALTAQQPGWRGHPWRSRMLRRLAELQSTTGQPVAALASWQAARASAADPEAATAIGDDMRDRLRGLLRASGANALPPVAALALYRAHGELLGDDPDGTQIRLGLATRAAENGLLETAANLLGQPNPGRSVPPGYEAASLALTQASEAARDQPARQRWAALRQRGDWAEIARTAAGELPPDDANPLAAPAAEAAVWLTLAQIELRQPERAVELAQRLSGRIGEAGPGTLLELAAQTGPTSVTTADLPAALGVYAAKLRRTLDKLPPLAGDHSEAAVRSAAERSNPAG